MRGEEPESAHQQNNQKNSAQFHSVLTSEQSFESGIYVDQRVSVLSEHRLAAEVGCT